MPPICGIYSVRNRKVRFLNFLVLNTNKCTGIKNTLSHTVYQDCDMFRPSDHQQGVLHETSIYKTAELSDKLKFLVLNNCGYRRVRSKCVCKIDSYNLDICTYIGCELSDIYSCKDKKKFNRFGK